ncbi:MAG: hypothetical protein K8F52_16720 [Candidatus Scalindua rubra]|uniref:Uncharacterized protein n=1 Tax=Candidatus Scalindua brodae TaxID=237368 RepID=A0A0B0EQ71_9BACT|nr:MAG: hypothetical protein SCABRO_00938 [Candidatus Scalindua brodae]MBZ0110294.1 hypothetical protein [Candidatus Scalindua rubra]
MKKWIRNIFFIIGVIGLIAIPEDLNKWMKIFGSNMDISTIVNQNIRWIVFGICMFVALIFSGIHRKIWCKRTILQIKFDKNDPRYIYDEYANYGVNIGEKISERTFRICIINLSKSKIIVTIHRKYSENILEFG